MRGSDLIHQFLTPQFRRFLVMGGIAACVNIGSRALYDVFLPYTAAIALAYLSGIITAYWLTRTFVFVDSQRRHSEASLRFLAVNALGFAQTWAVSIALGDHVLPGLGVTSHAHDIAHIIGVGAPVFTSFIAHRRWTFG